MNSKSSVKSTSVPPKQPSQQPVQQPTPSAGGIARQPTTSNANATPVTPRRVAPGTPTGTVVAVSPAVNPNARPTGLPDLVPTPLPPIVSSPIPIPTSAKEAPSVGQASGSLSDAPIHRDPRPYPPGPSNR